MIAVVGATGSVGSALVALLAGAGEPVRAFTRRPGQWAGPDVEVVGAIVTRSREGLDPLPAAAELIGRPPRRFADWARDHAAMFT